MNSADILALIDARRFDEAKAALQNRMAQNSTDIEALFIYASLSYGAESYDEAATIIGSALRVAPQAVPLLALAGDIALIRGQADLGMAFFEEAYRLQPSDITLMRKLWREWQLRGDARAMVLTTQMLARDYDAATWHALAHDHVMVGDHDTALAYLDRALQIAAPDHKQALLGDRFALTGIGEGDFLQADPLTREDSTALTVIITTNLTKKLVVNKAKGPPSDVMIRETLESFHATLKPAADTRLVILYDMPSDTSDPDHATYLAALEKLAGDYNAELHCRAAAGLKVNYLEAVDKLETPYVMLLEHDWLFNANAPTLAQMIGVLQQHDDVHLLRLNKRPNVAMRDDFYLWRTPSIRSAPILRTLCYSNNPHVLRVSKLRRDFLPVITGEARHDGINSGAGGIEETMKGHLIDLANRHGPLLAQRWAGTAVWGQENDAPRLTHTGI